MLPAVVLSEPQLLLVYHCLEVPVERSAAVLARVALRPVGGLQNIELFMFAD